MASDAPAGAAEVPEGAAAERQRLADDDRREARWRRWGPYLSDRQWGTVREDYSADGNAWEHFPFEQARSRAYRWGEDGLLGLCDNHQRLCFALALWNGRDPFLKERLFGLSGPQGNHGEDVKEIYFHRDSTPSHSWMRALYRYPHGRFPYEDLIAENGRRGRDAPEYELLDTGIFTGDRFCDIEVTYAKGAPDDILIRLCVTNRGPDPHTLHLLPTLWFRNTWSWGGEEPRPSIRPVPPEPAAEPAAPPAPESTRPVPWRTLAATHPEMGTFWLHAEQPAELLATDNETNARRLFGAANAGPYVKDGINDRVVAGDRGAVNPEGVGTKASLHYVLPLAAGETRVLKLRLVDRRLTDDPLGAGFEAISRERQREADAFYAALLPAGLPPERLALQRQAFAGLLWSKQTYLYGIRDWLAGDAATPPPPSRRHGRNHQWPHFHADDVLSMPDGWEYPWFAAWDLAFHCVPLALVDPGFAKHQLDLLTREWFMHPNGQLPAYEWAFGDVNPPAHAWATWQVYSLEKRATGRGDRPFLERVFQKLLLNFTWWVNRKDAEGNNIFQGGFLGLDNIGVFDRSAPLPTGGFIEQADGTSWMGMFCLNMLTISLELAQENPVYEDMATKFFEHFLYIAAAMNASGSDGGHHLWDDGDGFFHDVLHLPDGQRLPLKIRSMVGLIPLFAIAILEPEVLERLPAFRARLEWFIQHRPDLKVNVACMETRGQKARRLLALTYLSPNRFVAEDRFRRILKRLFDPAEFLGDHGIRSLSRHHAEHPYVFSFEGREHRVGYEPAESRSGLFGGNSNWRGPVWFPVNHLLIEALQQFHRYAGDGFQVECPTGSGQWLSLQQAADLISERLIGLFLPRPGEPPPAYGATAAFLTDAEGQRLHLFHEYFHGDDGTGLGASHQTGWTGLVAQLIHDHGLRMAGEPPGTDQPPR